MTAPPVSPSSSTGTIETIAGDGTAGYSGDGGPATAAELNGPWGLAVDPSGDVFIADSHNNVIREVRQRDRQYRHYRRQRHRRILGQQWTRDRGRTG